MAALEFVELSVRVRIPLATPLSGVYGALSAPPQAKRGISRAQREHPVYYYVLRLYSLQQKRWQAIRWLHP